MRISAGEHRGRRLQSPKGSRTRPTSDLLRQALFNVLGPRIEGASVLDLFAGTGAVGLEALSRGAATATFVENERRAVESLRANLARLKLTARARVLVGDVFSRVARLERAGERFDCIFLDPPYGTGDLAIRCIEMLAHGAVLRENGVLLVQAFHKTALPERVGTLRGTWRRRYGESSLTLYCAVDKIDDSSPMTAQSGGRVRGGPSRPAARGHAAVSPASLGRVPAPEAWVRGEGRELAPCLARARAFPANEAARANVKSKFRALSKRRRRNAGNRGLSRHV